MTLLVSETEYFETNTMPLPGCGCLLWIGSWDRAGYGIWSREKKYLAHRKSWEIHNKKPVPFEMKILHRCDVRCCVEPSHLFVGTQADNVADMFAKGRQGARNGRQGEAHHGAKLSALEVLKIRAQYVAGGVSMHALAKIYGVGSMTICRAINGESWSHI